MTTLRPSPSPTEPVVTPPSSERTRWTMRRSPAGIGSRVMERPGWRTRAALRGGGARGGAAPSNEQAQVIAADVEHGAGAAQAVPRRLRRPHLGLGVDLHEGQELRQVVRRQVHLRRLDVLDLDIADFFALVFGLGDGPRRPLFQGGDADARLFAADAEEAGLAGGEYLYVDLLALKTQLLEGDVDRLIDAFCAYLYAFHGQTSLLVVQRASALRLPSGHPVAALGAASGLRSRWPSGEGCASSCACRRPSNWKRR